MEPDQFAFARAPSGVFVCEHCSHRMRWLSGVWVNATHEPRGGASLYALCGFAVMDSTDIMLDDFVFPRSRFWRVCYYPMTQPISCACMLPTGAKQLLDVVMYVVAFGRLN